MGLPLLVAVTTGLVWLLAVGTAQVRAVDAARETARAVARGDDLSAAVGRGGQVAPEGAAVRGLDGCRGGPGRRDGGRARPGRVVRLPAVRAAAGGGRRGGGGAAVSRDDRGAASLLVVACVALLLLIGCALGVVAAMVRAHRAAQSAADLAALAGAAAHQRGESACAAAGSVATANGASVDTLLDGRRRRVGHRDRAGAALARPDRRPLGGGSCGAGVSDDVSCVRAGPDRSRRRTPRLERGREPRSCRARTPHGS